MERLKKIINQIASTPDSRLADLPILHRSLVPLLSFASSLYRLSLALRRRLYLSGVLPTHRLPVPVISVGNLTWGGNGKTPMTEFIAASLAEAGIPPLILTRGYAGGDEAKMLQRHLLGTSIRIGVGANRSAVAASILEKYGWMGFGCIYEKVSSPDKFGPDSKSEKIGVVILDDGMQHWSLLHDVEIIMLNGLMPWGNNHLIPRGSLREPSHALGRADIVVIHHADLATKLQLEILESTVQKVSASIRIYFTRLAPLLFFEVKNPHCSFPLNMVHNVVVLCVSAIGFADAFVQGIEKIGPVYVDRVDFCDHYFIKNDDIDMIRKRLKKLEGEFDTEVIIVVTEKDYDRDPIILKKQDDLTILVLCSSIQIMPFKGRTEESFRIELKKLLIKQTCR